MSVVNIRAALETAVNNMTPSLSTAWENNAFTPPASSVPYQQVWVMFARPDNAVFGTEHTELGIMQVDLMYPLQVGTAAVAARAELIRTTFKRGTSFTSNDITVNISDTPEVSNSGVDGDRYKVIVKIRFFAHIT